MKAGDLVRAKEDISRNIDCIGIIVECAHHEKKIMWSSETFPVGWWNIRDISCWLVEK